MCHGRLSAPVETSDKQPLASRDLTSTHPSDIAMTRFEELTIELPDGYRAYARYWDHPNPRGAVLYHHGIQSHCGW